ncbi:MAG: ferredoxin [Candidatus Bilamarchaeaceae archaeon]
MTVKIIHDRDVCIGCGACVAVCSTYWEMGDDGKSKLKGATNNGGKFVLEVQKTECNKDAAQSCPVNCIHIEENGKKLI